MPSSAACFFSRIFLAAISLTRPLTIIADELRDLGERVSDDLLLSMLTAGLNKEFSNAASNLTFLPDPTFPRVVTYLRLEERRMKMVKS